MNSLWNRCENTALWKGCRETWGQLLGRDITDASSETSALLPKSSRLVCGVCPQRYPNRRKSTVLAACVTAGFSWQVKCFPWSFYNRAFACFPTMPNWWADSAAYCITESHITGRLFTACLAWVLNFALFIDQNWGRRKEEFELFKMTAVLRFALVQWSKF